MRAPTDPTVVPAGKPWFSPLFKPAHRALVGTSAWGLADQVLISGATFGTMAYLAKGLGPAEFGAFSLAYLALLLANSMQGALVCQPHNILGSPLEGAAFRNFTSSLALGQLVVAATFGALVLAGAAVAAALGLNAHGLLLPLAVAIPAWQMQEFVRRVLYTKGRVQAALWNDAVSYGGQLALVIVLVARHDLTAALALYVVAATSAIAGIAGLWSIRSYLGGRLESEAINRSWKIGKWFFAATVANWLASQMYPVLTAGLLGVYATGVFRALQNLIAPTQILANAFQTLATPHASREHARGGRQALTSFLARGTVLLAIPLLGYLVLVGVFARPLITFFYSSAYAQAAFVIWPLGVAYLLSYAGRVLGIGLAASHMSRPLFYAQLMAAATTFSAGLVLIRSYGLIGAAWGAALTQAVQVAMLAWYLNRAHAHGEGSPVRR
jgi:O-antigen/teichoic acid export membrane protein